MNIPVKIKLLSACIIFILSALSVHSQNLIDGELKTLFAKQDSSVQDFKKPLKDAENEVDILFSSGFLAYKKLISSQDKPSCVFSPSCSEFAVEAINRHGVFMGWLATFDRLSRCHGFVNHAHYHFDNNKGLFYDPVK